MVHKVNERITTMLVGFPRGMMVTVGTKADCDQQWSGCCSMRTILKRREEEIKEELGIRLQEGIGVKREGGKIWQNTFDQRRLLKFISVKGLDSINRKNVRKFLVESEKDVFLGCEHTGIISQET